MIRALFALLGIRVFTTGNGGGTWYHLRIWGWITPGIKPDREVFEWCLLFISVCGWLMFIPFCIWMFTRH